MTIDKTRISDIRYNAAFSQFEAMVTLHDSEGQLFNYPVELEAPIDSSYRALNRAISAKAHKMHASKSADLRSVSAPRPAAKISELHGPSLVERLIGNFEMLFGKKAA